MCRPVILTKVATFIGKQQLSVLRFVMSQASNEALMFSLMAGESLKIACSTCGKATILNDFVTVFGLND